MFPPHDLAQLQGLPPALLGQPLYPLSTTGHPLLPSRANTQMQLAAMQQQLQQQQRPSEWRKISNIQIQWDYVAMAELSSQMLLKCGVFNYLVWRLVDWILLSCSTSQCPWHSVTEPRPPPDEWLPATRRQPPSRPRQVVWIRCTRAATPLYASQGHKCRWIRVPAIRK